MVRRSLLAVVLIVLALALLNSAVVGQFPKSWVPGPLVTLQRYVGAEGSVVGAVFGLGLIIIAINPLRYRLGVLLAILLGILSVAVQVDRYYGGQGDVVPPIVFWVAATALLMVLFPVRGGPAAAPVRPQPAPVSSVRRTGQGSQPPSGSLR